MLNRFKEQILTKALFSPHDTLLVGVSGGVDSMVLCDLLTQSDYKFEVAHTNHNTRGGESDKDEAFVLNHFTSAGIKVHVQHLESDFKGNFHDHAHKARYAFWDSLGYDKVLTAHHYDDHIETILVNIFNGRSSEGMLAVSKNIVRPLIGFRKADILKYAAENNIPFVEDKSNLSRDYLRNVIRMDVLPALSEVENLEAKLSHLSDRNTSDMRLLHNLVEEVVTVKPISESEWAIELSLFDGRNETFIFHALKEYEVSRSQAKDIGSCLGKAGKRFHTPSYDLIIGRQELFIHRSSDNPDIRKEVSLEALPSTIRFNNYNLEFSIVDELPAKFSEDCLYVPLDKVTKDLVIRTWQHGDSFQPFGMEGHTQTLKKYFVDHKVEAWTKKRLPLLVCGGDIVWIVGERSDERFRAGSENAPYLRVELK